MRYHQPQGYFRYFTIQLRQLTQNNQNCQTPSLFEQLILQEVGLSQNLDFLRSEIQKAETTRPGNFLILVFFQEKSRRSFTTHERFHMYDSST